MVSGWGGCNVNGKTKIIIGGICVLVVFLAGWYLFGNVSDNSGRIDSIRSELDTVKSNQSTAIKRLDTIEAGLDDSQKQAGRIAESIGESAKSVGTVEERITIDQGKLTDSTSLIADCQRILAEVRERGQVGEN